MLPIKVSRRRRPACCRILSPPVLLLAWLFGSGCAPASVEGGPRPTRHVLTQEEIAASGATNLYAAVERLRPQWFRTRPPVDRQGTVLPILVYQNDAPLGGIEVLRQISPEFAAQLRFLDGQTASNTLPGLGSRAVSGAIVIITPGRL
jgi:hypothetical protein